MHRYRRKNGEKQNIEMLISRYYSDILRYCIWHTSGLSAAEDATQETFLKLMRYFQNQVVKEKNIRPLLYRIAANTCIDMWRKKSAAEVSLDALYEQDIMEEVVWETGYEQVLSDLEIQRLVRCLPENQREIIILRYSQDLTLREIAQVVELPLRTVQSRLRSALHTLKKRLEKEE